MPDCRYNLSTKSSHHKAFVPSVDIPFGLLLGRLGVAILVLITLENVPEVTSNLLGPVPHHKVSVVLCGPIDALIDALGLAPDRLRLILNEVDGDILRLVLGLSADMLGLRLAEADRLAALTLGLCDGEAALMLGLCDGL
jgi:hypothetical protein